MWKKYPENKPKLSGYYYTYYYNTQHQAYFYKSLWYSVKEERWIWRIEPLVMGYVEETLHNYYVPSTQLAIDLNIGSFS